MQQHDGFSSAQQGLARAMGSQPQTAGAIFRGALGRTLRIPMSVTSEVGETFTASVFIQVNVTDDKALRAAINDGTLNVVADPHSGARYGLAVPLIYHDEALQLFALFVPNCLRHQEFELRRELIDQLSKSAEPLPEYVRRYRVIFGIAELERVEYELREARAGGGGSGAQAAELIRLRKELDSRERRLAEDRHGLEAMRLNLETLQARLKDQEESLVRAGKIVAPRDDEPTAVVPREVFYAPTPAAKKVKKRRKPRHPDRSVVPGPALTGESQIQNREDEWETGLEEGWELEEETGPPPIPTTPAPAELAKPPVVARSQPQAPAHRSAPAEVSVTDDLPRSFNRLKAGSRAYYHAEAGPHPLMAYRLSEARLKTFLKYPQQLYLQFHDLDEFPLITLLLAAHDDEGNTVDDIYWPIDVRKPIDRRLLDRLMADFTLRVGLYGEDLQLRQVLTFDEPLELNATHITQLAERSLTVQRGESVSFDEGVRCIEAPDYERLGSMRHNFHSASFVKLKTTSEVKLAAGIVGYWSGAETFRYLIENRSFSLEWFAQIQERVVRAALKTGIALTAELRQVAIDIDLAVDEGTLIKSLATTWAQVSLGLGGYKNDLDALGAWDNWQTLLDSVDDLNVRLDDELVELASAALRRAHQYVKENDLPANLPEEGGLEEATPVGSEPAAAELTPTEEPEPEPAEEAPKAPAPETPAPRAPISLNPEPATVLDTTGGLGERSNAELVALLRDEDARLAAATQLLLRGGRQGVIEVLNTAEDMTDDELAVLSETLSGEAPNLEDVLLHALKSDNPTITYLASFALCAMSSERASGPLLALVQDLERAPDPAIYIDAIALYGESILDELVEAIGEAEALEANHPLVVLLAEIARNEGPVILEYVEADNPEAAGLARGLLD